MKYALALAAAWLAVYFTPGPDGTQMLRDVDAQVQYLEMK